MKSLDEEKTSVEEELRRLQNRQKVLLNKKSDAERKARTRRLIEHGAILESVFPSVIHLSGDDVKSLLVSVSRLPEVRKLLPKDAETEDTE